MPPPISSDDSSFDLSAELAISLKHEPSTPIKAIRSIFGSKIGFLQTNEMDIIPRDLLSEFYLFSVRSHISLHARHVFTVSGLRHLRELEKEVLRRSSALKKGFRRVYSKMPLVEPLARALEVSSILKQFLVISWPYFHIANYEKTGNEVYLKFSKVAGKEHERAFLLALETLKGIHGKRHRNVFAAALNQAKRF